VAESRSADPTEAAWSRLHVRASEALAADSGARLSPDGRMLRLTVVDREFDIDVPARQITYAEGERPAVSAHIRILILHYLAAAGQAHVANGLATFREFEGGDLYYPAFKSRVIDRIVGTFGAAPGVLRQVGETLGAEPVNAGDVGFRVPFFPKLPIVVVLWLGDDEVSPAANVLFDANAGLVLPTEDLAVAAEALVHRLIEVSKR